MDLDKEELKSTRNLYSFGMTEEELCERIFQLEKELKEEKEKNEILINITYMYNTYEANNENKIIIADKEYFDNGLFTRKFINKDKIRKILDKSKKGDDFALNILNDVIENLTKLLEE